MRRHAELGAGISTPNSAPGAGRRLQETHAATARTEYAKPGGRFRRARAAPPLPHKARRRAHSSLDFHVWEIG